MYISSYFNLSAVRIHLTADDVLIFMGNALLFLSYLEVRRRTVDLTIRGISDFFFFLNMAVASINAPITSTLQTVSQKYWHYHSP